MNIGEKDSLKEEVKRGYDSQENDFISLCHFELLERLIKRVYSPILLFFTIL